MACMSSRRAVHEGGPLREWLKVSTDKVGVVARYCLAMNAKWLIRNDLGAALVYDELPMSLSSVWIAERIVSKLPKTAGE